MVNARNLDYGNIKFLLSKSNPEVYGNGQQKVLFKQEGVKEKVSFKTTNDSGYSLLGGNLNVDTKKL
ncbi:MAG: hypothetical protein ACRC63_00170 [Metamycoplasmataceae bacterium]